MKILKYFLGIFVIFIFCTAGDYTQAPTIDLPGGALLRPYKQFYIGEGEVLSLESSLFIQTEEAVIDGTLVTNGKGLHIDVQRLVFGPSGSIVGFDRPAAPQTAMRLPKGTADPGYDFPDWGGSAVYENMGRNGKKGGNGAVGETGDQGLPGYDGEKNVQGVIIYAAEVQGNPVINVRGQKGGKGGKGGEGGKGGRGGRGSMARADGDLFGDNSRKAGPGGDGGQGGAGGKGGTGGKGGSPIPLTFVVGSGFETLNLSGIQYGPGEAGDPGEGGDGGKRGAPGAGGPGEVFQIIFVFAEEKKGSDGKIGDPGEKGPAGDPGLPGDNTLAKDQVFYYGNLSSLEKARTELGRSWLSFHWIRTLYLLTQDSIRLLHSEERTREDIKNLANANPDSAKEFEQFISEIQRENVASVVEAWKTFFINPLESKSDQKNRISVIPVSELVKLAKEFLKILETLEGEPDIHLVLKKYQDHLKKWQEMLNLDLSLALSACQEFKKIKDRKFSEIIHQDVVAITARYSVPVCSRNPDLTQPENLFSEILLSETFEVLVTPENLKSQYVKDIPSAEVKNQHSMILQDLFFDRAWASDWDVILVGGKELRRSLVLKNKLANGPVVSDLGVLSGYSVPQEKEVDLSSVGYQLRVLSVLLEDLR